MPHSVHHNNITVDNNEEMIPCRAAVPRIAGRIGVFAPSSFRYNNVNFVSRKTASGFSDAPPNPYTDKKDGDGFNVHFTNNSAVQVSCDSSLTKSEGFNQKGYWVFDTIREMEHAPQASVIGEEVEQDQPELGEKHQMKLLQGVNPEEKLRQTKLRIAQAKSNFQKAMEQLNDELTVAKKL